MGLISRVSSRTYRPRRTSPSFRSPSLLSQISIMTSVFAGNIAWRCTEQELGDAFAQYGFVNSVQIIMDRVAGRSKGFGFVEFADPNCVDMAIQNMDGYEIGGRPLRVN